MGDRAQKRREDEAVATVRQDEYAAPAPGTDVSAILGRGCEFEGKLTFEGKVRIDGRFDGQIVTNDVLMVGEEARVTAEISCGTLVCHGEIIGNVRAKSGIELHRPARLKGNVTTSALSIEKGVYFDGQSKMEGSDLAQRAHEPTPSNVTPIAASARGERPTG